MTTNSTRNTLFAFGIIAVSFFLLGAESGVINRIELLESAQPPIGSVMPYAGDLTNEKTANILEKGWKPCNGEELRKEDLPDLYRIIGNLYGGSEQTFKLPDYRGAFLRGVSDDKGNNSDFVNSGNIIGTVQGSSTKMPNNSFSIAESGAHTHVGSTSEWKQDLGINYSDDRFPERIRTLVLLREWKTRYEQKLGDHRHDVTIPSSGAHSHQLSGGDVETRPYNVSVNWIIRIK